ncbi:DUF3891 family protein [Pontibacter akesuensis]|uniref:DUF3891 domain-containing protein n=1 Tax=Pontibacter akesuensis TaxID=388950 RepID=A0A1I7IBX1_9BACT|nr:DUF3891 family protein [Pontibacter akesuensis]GHA66292.1 hypothetical protein GCM10007389_19170 [Pontibacter akesuensis]SFU70473.1 Protein of unknown function [Pontibacter akesuensis]
MIVNPIPEGWEVIYQQAHGMLAAQLAYYLQPELQCGHWVETLVAIANHDNRQRTWRGKDGLTPAGAPADFTLQPNTLEQARALMDAVRFQSRWAAMLTSMHMSYLYESRRGESKETNAFLDAQQELQKNCRQSLRISHKQAARAYAIMQWSDRLSLILCRNELPADARELEITTGPDAQVYFVKQLENEQITITPWPFTPKQLEVQVEYRVLEQLQFKDDAELAQALQQAEVRYKTWRFSKA